MKKDSKLSGVLHILLHMAAADTPATSETLAKMMRTNPVVIRRVLAGLREHGFVTSEKGHGGGWQLSCDLTTVTLRDIYVALGTPALFALGNRTEAPGCLVEQAVNTVMNQALHDAEALLLTRFSEVTLAEMSHHIPHSQTGNEHHGHDGHHNVFKGIDRWLKALDGPEREKSQRPHEVIAALGLQPNDVVADIGAGTGYFALRIAEAYPQVKVIAADSEQEMIDYLQSQSEERNLANLELVLIDPARPELPIQANLALLVNTLHHISDRVAYLKRLNKSMAPGSRIAVIDYTIEAPEGPPADHRIPAEVVLDELKQAGYALESDWNILPSQYFLIFKQG
jgi:DNA-binding IscR family transcriptional regulator/ubiquinone/menaquinone biosynthesis C-methylase UbiE